MFSDLKKRSFHAIYRIKVSSRFCQNALMGTCVICHKALQGRQSKYCSRKCKNASTNCRCQSYKAQQSRGRRRKIRLVNAFGGCCSNCGYSRNYSALEFHHVDPANKRFQLDLRSLSNRSWVSIIREAAACVLVCSNCHKEIHHPESSLEKAKKSQAYPGFSCRPGGRCCRFRTSPQ